jgi:thymidine phosphorylase
MSAAQSAADAAVEPFDAVDVIRTKRDRGRCPRTPCAG